MRVLWSCNIVPNAVRARLNGSSEVMGGWIESMAAALTAADSGLSLGVACRSEDVGDFHETADGIEYFSIDCSGADYKDLCASCSGIIESFRPDLVQVEGTEFLHSKAMLFTAKAKGIPTVVSLQGVLNGLYDYQCGEIPVDELMLSRSLTNIFAGWTMHLRKTRWFRPRLAGEREIIENTSYILGRTTWDRAHSYSINPEAKYFSCPRVLREPFYETKWDPASVERHSIYTGSGYTALKGLHFLIRALPQLAAEYPDVKVYVAGYDPYPEKGRRPAFKQGYAMYLKKLMRDLDVEDRVVFTGTIPAQEVARRLARSHVYALTSTIENSPNTLAEAMCVGTPCVASCVGGAPDMADNEKEALFFRSGDPSLIAWNIKRIFDDDALALMLSENARARASVTHDPGRNAAILAEVYSRILSESE